jgi:hypothetical protein
MYCTWEKSLADEVMRFSNPHNFCKLKEKIEKNQKYDGEKKPTPWPLLDDQIEPLLLLRQRKIPS